MDSFEIIERLGGGHFADRLAEELIRVSEEVVATGRKGSVGVTFNIECPDNTVADPMVSVSASFKMNLPQRNSGTTGFYYYDGDYHRSPKSQQPFPPEIMEMQEDYNKEEGTDARGTD